MPFIHRILLGAVLLLPFRAGAAEARLLPPRIDLRDNWSLNSSAVVKESGQALSTGRFAPQGWWQVSVPITVLNALTKHRVYPDMRLGLNFLQVPDASDEFNRKYDIAQYSHISDQRNPWTDPWWYRTEFRLPHIAPGTRTWLHFDSINYRGEVWLNGNKVAGRDEIVSLNQRFAFDVSRFVRPGLNHLAVKVFRVDHVGPPGVQLVPFGPSRFEDHVSDGPKDFAIQLAGGYDNFPNIQDRFMGIVQDVWIDFSGPVVIRDPFIVTELPLPATDTAKLKISANLVNADAGPVTGVLKGTIPGTGLTFETSVTVLPGESKQVAFDPPPVMKNPRLWWPNGYGAQPLYDLELQFVAGAAVSHSQRVRFGVRQVSTEMHVYKGHHGRRILVNGQRVYARGGYLQPEVLFDWNQERVEAEMRYFARAHLNLTYFEDVANPPDYLLDACDRYGIMFGNCFYGCSWMQPGTDYPADVPLVVKCTRDIIKRYRNHPSLILYMAADEGFTREEVYVPWRQAALELDGTRFLLPSGYFPDPPEILPYLKRFGGKVPHWFLPDLPTGMNDARPKTYTWQDPSTYYQWVRDEPTWMFKIESGSASLPPISSLRRFIFDLGETSEGAPFPLNRTWAHHGANNYYKDYDAALRRLYGEPATVVDYCWRGHLTTADQHRAMFEAINHRLWDVTSGFTQWKINTGWPDVQWQLVDWFLKPMVSYYFVKRANAPLHIQLGMLEPTVTVVNHTLEPKRGLTARARLLDLSARVLLDKRAEVDVGANTYRDVLDLPQTPGLPPVYFVRLDLTDREGRRIADNLYWLPSGKQRDMQGLHSLPLVPLTVRQSVEESGSRASIHVTVENPTDDIAFFVQLAAVKPGTGEEILPSYWSDNYISLLPRERRSVTVEMPKSALEASRPTVEVGGWNIRTPYRVTALMVPPSAKAGVPFQVEAAVSGTFLDGSRVDVMVDGRTVASQYHAARPGETAAAKFSLQLPAGEHTVTVGTRAARVVVR